MDMQGRPSGTTAMPDLIDLPVRLPRDELARLISKYFFRVSPRSMERWPLAWRRVNGKAHGETADAFAVANSMLEAAPVLMGGRREARLLETPDGR
jgi:hypothetical protein